MSDETEGLGITGKIREKLVRTKEKWAREGRALTGRGGHKDRDRLPPGQRLVTDWPILDLGIQPDVPREAFSLTIDGLVEKPLTWDWDAFMAQPQAEDISDIHCVTTWSRYDNHWRGVSAAHVLAAVKPASEVSHVIFHSHDGYTTNVTLEMFAAPDVLLAHSWEGAPIAREHGGPVRIIMPQFYLWKSAKWLRRIEFCNADAPGFWEVRGYHNIGDPWKEERYG
jgi:DMSO/TMAO reductase YedYZ molybdopterin-dependent catalytic subunit